MSIPTGKMLRVNNNGKDDTHNYSFGINMEEKIVYIITAVASFDTLRKLVKRIDDEEEANR